MQAHPIEIYAAIKSEVAKKDAMDSEKIKKLIAMFEGHVDLSVIPSFTRLAIGLDTSESMRLTPLSDLGNQLTCLEYAALTAFILYRKTNGHARVFAYDSAVRELMVGTTNPTFTSFIKALYEVEPRHSVEVDDCCLIRSGHISGEEFDGFITFVSGESDKGKQAIWDALSKYNNKHNQNARAIIVCPGDVAACEHYDDTMPNYLYLGGIGPDQVDTILSFTEQTHV